MILRERKLNRLTGYNYSQEGWYFVTIDCMKMYSWFGKINVGDGHCPSRTIMKLNNYGLVAEKYWRSIPKIYNNVVLDEFVIMPNHMHGILVITDGEVHTGKGKGKAFDLITRKGLLMLK